MNQLRNIWSDVVSVSLLVILTGCNAGSEQQLLDGTASSDQYQNHADSGANELRVNLDGIKSNFGAPNRVDFALRDVNNSGHVSLFLGIAADFYETQELAIYHPNAPPKLTFMEYSWFSDVNPSGHVPHG